MPVPGIRAEGGIAMGDQRPILKPADLRRAVSEWAAQGFSVKVEPNGTITVTPPAHTLPADSFDIVDMRR